MATSSQEVKRRINAVRTTKKITKAMELVATSKLRKALINYQKREEYITSIYNVVTNIIKKARHFRLPTNDSKNKLYIVINSDLGLCGGFNNNLNKSVAAQIKENDTVINVGRKSEHFYKKLKVHIARSYYRIADDITFDFARNIGLEVLTFYQQGDFSSIFICYNKFINSLTVEPRILKILPIEKDTKKQIEYKLEAVTVFEPDIETVFKSIVPFYINSIIYGTLIESKVSEFSSRRTAMENASQNADDIETNLLLLFNRARQSAITREISEIVAGADANEG